VTTRKGMSKRVKSERASEFAQSVCEHVRWHLTAINCRPPAPPYRLTLHLYPPIDGRKHDASNTVKIPEDALMEAIKGDDDDVLEVHVLKHAKDRQPRLEMTLEHVEIREV
jgi:Holliday junction resolvase RusA-like endonuclease